MAEVWNSTSFYGCKQFVLVKKLKSLKYPLRKLNKDCYGNIHSRLEEARHKLHLLQIESLSSPHPDILQAELAQSKLVQDLANAEEAFLLQKSRIKWLKEGDKNTSFFHKSLLRKQFKDKIKMLIDPEGNQLTTKDEIAAEAVRFYKIMLGSSDPNCTGGSLANLQTLLPVVPAHMASMFTAIPSYT